MQRQLEMRGFGVGVSDALQNKGADLKFETL